MSRRSVFSFVPLFGLLSYGLPAPVCAEEPGADPAALDESVNSSLSEAVGPLPATRPTAHEIRSQVRLALRQPLKTLATAPYAKTRVLVELYAQLQTDESLPSVERERFQNLVRTRLAQARGTIVRGLRRRQTEAERSARRQGSADGRQGSADGSSGGADISRVEGLPLGGNPQSEAQELIELIETTIAPASWEARGGRGAIKYWAPGHALVIRQTREVHEQIGGVVGAMRP